MEGAPICALRAVPIFIALAAAASAQSILDTIDGPAAGAQLGWLVDDAGDIDADGVCDLLVGAPYHTPPASPAEAGSLFVYSGATGALLHHWTGDVALKHFGWLAAGAGDVDADGYDDVVAKLPSQNALRVFSGSSGLPLFDIHPAFGNNPSPLTLDGAGDWNADGHADIVVGYPYTSVGSGAYLMNDVGLFEVYSGVDGSMLDATMGAQEYTYLGMHVCGIGDVDGNGFDDVLVVAEPNFNGVVSVYGGPSGSVLYQLDDQTTSTWSMFGADVAALGDVDGDGRSDLLVGAPAFTEFGAVHLFSGATGALIFSVLGDTSWAYFGSWVAAGRDLNLDGVPDCAAGSPGLGRVRLISGADGSEIRTYDQTQLGEPPGDAFALVDDRDGNRAGEVAFGLPTASPAGPDSGRAILFAGCDGCWAGFGAGLTGSGGFTPNLFGADCPLPGQTVEIRVADGLGGAPGALLYGLAPTALPIFGGHLLVGLPELWFHGLGGASGAAGQGAIAIPVPLPNKPALSGKSIFLQAWYLDLGAVQGISMTAGLQLAIG